MKAFSLVKEQHHLFLLCDSLLFSKKETHFLPIKTKAIPPCVGGALYPIAQTIFLHYL